MLVLVLGLGAGIGESVAQVTPAHVYARVGLVESELELVRRKLGGTLEARPLLQVRNAAPREVIFQAATMFRKADQLAFERTRTRVELPALPAAAVQPSDVRAVVDAALTRLLAVKVALQIDVQVTEAPVDPAHTPSDVFSRIIQVNRQFNHVLQDEFSPADVFGQVTLAVGYAGRRSMIAGGSRW